MNLRRISEPAVVKRYVALRVEGVAGLLRGVVRGRWRYSQELYDVWSRQPLPADYIMQIVRVGGRFADFVGSPVGCCLDLGCGNGLIGGRSYRDVGYSYIHKSGDDLVFGVDPMVLQGDKPSFIDVLMRGRAEELTRLFADRSFDTVVVATSLEHFEDVDKSLAQIKRVMRATGRLNIWASTFKKPPRIHSEHRHIFTSQSLLTVLSKHFNIVSVHREPFNIGAVTVFIKAKKKSPEDEAQP